MKNIAAQMVNFDREQMRRIANNMPEQYDEKPQVQQVAQIINGVFSQLRRNHRDMCVLFRWACQDNFWSGNVLSPAKLRDKWTQLEINRNKQQAGVTASKPKLDLTNTDWIYGVDL
ncbi:replication protein O [Escherichia coli]|uniref:replication protein O n=1 Tax=Escherichia coli TaxID=562 RepID=UPI000D590F11